MSKLSLLVALASIAVTMVDQYFTAFAKTVSAETRDSEEPFYNKTMLVSTGCKAACEKHKLLLMEILSIAREPLRPHVEAAYVKYCLHNKKTPPAREYLRAQCYGLRMMVSFIGK